MGTVFRSVRRYRIVVNSNDHGPPHVHAYGKGLEARFKLNCPAGPAEYWDHRGPWRLLDLNELGQEISDSIVACCEEWSEIHG